MLSKKIKNKLELEIKKFQWYFKPNVITNKGYCPICDKQVNFFSKHQWLRDNYLCSNYKSIPRERALMLCIERYYPNWINLKIHESSPGTRGASLKLSRQCKNYIGTHYFPNFPLGETHKTGFRNEDLENQTFPDSSFDLVITQDVFEHIFNSDSAFAEIARTLKPGGAHIFTVPIVMKDKPSCTRAIKDEKGEVQHILEPQYHENPVNKNGSLVTKDWGYDITEYIWRHSTLPTTIVVLDDLEHGIRAEYIEVLISRKAAGTNDWLPSLE